MSKKAKKHSQPEAEHNQQNSLRSELENEEEYKMGAARLNNILGFTGRRETVPDEFGNDMLSIMVSAALKGIDITKRYPSFYKQMLHNSELMQAFIDAFDTVAKEEKLPEDLPENQYFLVDLFPKPSLEVENKDNWRIHWKRTIEQLRETFSPKEFAYRFDPSISEDPWFILLRDELEMEGRIVTVILEGVLSEEVSDSFEAILNVTVTDLATQEEVYPRLKSTLHWGKYTGETEISEEGKKAFPPILISTILDKGNENFIADLQLDLATVST
ncbi:MAG: hypothetical protein PVF83_11485 [Anaerolineales bacterium]|jgi:hypothetical protein